MEPPERDDAVEQLLATLLDDGDVKHWRVVGAALEGLIRCARNSDVLVPGLARRLMDVWMPHQAARLLFQIITRITSATAGGHR